MKWLIINTESFSPRGLKQKEKLDITDLPSPVTKFLSAYPKNFVILDESSKIKTNHPVKEAKKSSRTRLIKLLGKCADDRCIMTGTLTSKSPVNAYDQFDFLREGYFPESMYQFAETYCVMMTIRVGRGRRVLISPDTYEAVRKRLKKAYLLGGEGLLKEVRVNIHNQYGISYDKQEHIIRNRKYTPFVNVDKLLGRITKDTLFVNRKDIFDIRFEKFVLEPIPRPVDLSQEAKRIANNLIDLGFTDKFVLGRAAALDLNMRLQDICNGFEPLKDENGNITYRAFSANPKVDELMELLEEIDVSKSQVVVWSSRKLLIEAVSEALRNAEIPYVVYDGDKTEAEKAQAEEKFKNGEARVFVANQASGAYGLNCLASAKYAVYLCVDGSVEKFHQSQHRLLRGQLTEPKFAYSIYAAGSVEERQWNSLRIGQELIGMENKKEIFTFV